MPASAVLCATTIDGPATTIDGPEGERYPQLMSDPHDPSDDDPLFGGDDELRSNGLLDSVIPEVIRRVVERVVDAGVEKFSEGPENIRNKVADLKLPKEAATYLYQQIDDTKKGVYRVVAKEIRDVLEHTNLSDEIADVLTKLQFEITTQIRFVPHKGVPQDEEGGEDAQEDAEGAPARKRTTIFPRPDVVSKVAVKAIETLTQKKSSPSDES